MTNYVPPYILQVKGFTPRHTVKTGCVRGGALFRCSLCGLLLRFVSQTTAWCFVGCSGVFGVLPVVGVFCPCPVVFCPVFLAVLPEGRCVAGQSRKASTINTLVQMKSNVGKWLNKISRGPSVFFTNCYQLVLVCLVLYFGPFGLLVCFLVAFWKSLRSDYRRKLFVRHQTMVAVVIYLPFLKGWCCSQLDLHRSEAVFFGPSKWSNCSVSVSQLHWFLLQTDPRSAIRGSYVHPFSEIVLYGLISEKVFEGHALKPFWALPLLSIGLSHRVLHPSAESLGGF